ncbi:DoxX family protein [Halocatena pleomorpha]|uniref:DoxX family protein n=1 Tax=Halocatena pleomorpha TaxID=1785090 RepID=A0A3P3RJ84_9EURY|nr:DoxX family protein [Halocatena pleomorpha]RRJ33586.1 DoxX family protein [Halocatena pleomorpha]
MSNTNKWGPLLIRIGLGAVMIVHGIGKLMGVGPAAMPISDFAATIGGLGFPATTGLAWLVALIEFGGGVLLVAGLFVRYAAIGVAINMLVATVLVHLPQGFSGYEYTLVLFFMALSLVATGPGQFSLTHTLFDGELYWPTVDG